MPVTTTTQVRQMRALRLQGVGLAEIARRVGCSPSTVHRHVIGVDGARRRALTEDEAATCAFLASHGETLEHIAARFGVSTSVVRTVLRIRVRDDEARMRKVRTVRQLARMGQVAINERLTELEREVARLRDELRRVTT